MSQTNIKSGPISVNCGEDLTSAADLLVKMSHTAGVPKMVLPSESHSEAAVYLVLEGAVAGEKGSFAPLHTDRNVRIPIVGAGDPGDLLMLANPEDPALRGKVTLLSDAPGTYQVVGILEEDAVDGQLALIRPLPYAIVTVT